MAGEIKHTTKLQLTADNLQIAFGPPVGLIDQSAALLYDAVHAIGTAEESVATFGDVATYGRALLHNMDATNYVQAGFSTTVYGLRMPAGEWSDFRLEPGSTLFLKANTATCNVRILVLSD